MADNITAREALESLRQWTDKHYRSKSLHNELDRRIAALPETASIVDAACAKLRDEEHERLVKMLRDTLFADETSGHWTPSLARACARLLLHTEGRRG